jgi:hypothetical protein
MKYLLTTHIIKFIANIFKSLSKLFYIIYKRLLQFNFLSSDSKKILKRNLKFKNLHKGQRAFVIVNGPSLKNVNLSLLKNEITFAVSGFYKHEIISTWQPTYYSILDKAFFENNEKSNIFFKQLNQKVDKSTFFLPIFRGYENNIKRQLLPLDQTFYIATSGPPSQNLDLTNVIQSFQSVSAFALAQAIYMGFNEIYLLGFDHDYLAYRGIDRHFYDGPTLNGHISSILPLSELTSYEYEMKSCLKLWNNYKSLKRIAKKRNIKIFNATKGGYLDIFDRINFESLF